MNQADIIYIAEPATGNLGVYLIFLYYALGSLNLWQHLNII